MRRSTLMSLPVELLVKIMEIGDGRSVLACSGVRIIPNSLINA
jgi:hypothetical protein